MKKLTLLCVFVFFNTLVFAQSSSHLLFKGLYLDGDVETFTNKLKAAGFIAHPDSWQYTTDALLKGTFAGMDNCTIKVKAMPQSKTVYKVEVVTDIFSSWYPIHSAYQELVESYSIKYHKIYQSNYISYPYSSVAGWEIKAIYKEKYLVYTSFSAEGGTIIIMIKANSEDEAFIEISYMDNINTQKYSSEISASTMEDI